MENKNLYRHGDLWIIPIEKLPQGVIKSKDNILARGEHTGHTHTLTVENEMYHYFVKDQKKYLELKQKAEVKHQEHKTIVIEPGIYKINVEQEYDPFIKRIREVAD